MHYSIAHRLRSCVTMRSKSQPSAVFHMHDLAYPHPINWWGPVLAETCLVHWVTLLYLGLRREVAMNHNYVWNIKISRFQLGQRPRDLWFLMYICLCRSSYMTTCLWSVFQTYIFLVVFLQACGGVSDAIILHDSLAFSDYPWLSYLPWLPGSLAPFISLSPLGHKVHMDMLSTVTPLPPRPFLRPLCLTSPLSLPY